MNVPVFIWDSGSNEFVLRRFVNPASSLWTEINTKSLIRRLFCIDLKFYMTLFANRLTRKLLNVIYC